MKLRYQLLLVSLLLLVFPWSAWQYLKTFDSVLRNSQTESLIDHATLIANRLAIAPALFDAPFVNVQRVQWFFTRTLWQ